LDGAEPVRQPLVKWQEPKNRTSNIMSDHLNILLLEDNPSDADLLLRELKKSGFIFKAEVVQTRELFETALHSFTPDIILSDFTLPSFDAVSAFSIKQKVCPQTPFIIISGTIGEENAVELIKNGVTDYALKDKLFTLPIKINRALTNAEELKAKHEIDTKLKIQTAELIIANKQLVVQFKEKEKRAAELVLLSRALEHQKEELKKANARLHEKAVLLQQQEEKLISVNDELEKRVLERTGELEVLNQELKVLNVSKDKFLAVISHDLRNPLTTLLLASEALSSETDKLIFDAVQPFVKIIHRSSHNILQQLNELVDWAQKQQEKPTLNAEKIHLLSAVQQSFELLSSNALLKNIVFENLVPAKLYVNADALMLRSILQNLVTNSIKYSFGGGQVKVNACEVEKMTEVCVIDYGIGMDTNARDHLFGRKNGRSQPGTNNEKGSGLGLVLVNDFVTQHNGTLRVESEINKGTSIFFTVPGCV
jgi:signal transduction histidine kinase